MMRNPRVEARLLRPSNLIEVHPSLTVQPLRNPQVSGGVDVFWRYSTRDAIYDPVMGKPDAVPQIVAIRTASLDDPSWFNPQLDVWTSDAHPWDQMNAALPKFEKYPL